MINTLNFLFKCERDLVFKVGPHLYLCIFNRIALFPTLSLCLGGFVPWCPFSVLGGFCLFALYSLFFVLNLELPGGRGLGGRGTQQTARKTLQVGTST